MRKHILLFSSVLVTILMLVGVAMISHDAMNIRAAEEIEEDTSRLLVNAEKWLNHQQAIEVAVRGFVLTGNQRYVTVVEQHRHASAEHIQAMRVVLGEYLEHAEQQLNGLLQFTENHQQKLDRAIAFKNSGDTRNAERTLLTRESESFIPGAQLIIDNFTHTLQTKRSISNREVSWTVLRGSIAFAFLVALMIVSVWVGYTVAARTRRRNEQLNRELQFDARELRKSEEKLAAIFALSPDPTLIARLQDGVLLYVSRSFVDFSGHALEEAIGHSTAPDDLGMWITGAERERWVIRLSRDGEVSGFETVFRLRNGNDRNVSLSGKVIDIDDEPCVITVIHDITERKRDQEHLEKIAYHDGLTHLPNRRLLNDRLQLGIAQNGRTRTSLAVCYLDLDGFKSVNDALGHEAGDELLIEVANRLKASVRGGDTVARLGGDEFVLLLSDLLDDNEYRLILDRVLREISAPYAIRDTLQQDISASVGVSLYPKDSDTPDILLRFADQAMYAAKQAGKNRYQMFDSLVERRVEARSEIRKRIRNAVSAGQCRLHYQPIVDCRLGRVTGVEALIRWEHPVLGLLSPAEFLPLIEHDDMASLLGTWVLREALRQIAAWQSQGIDLHVSVNAFVHQLETPGFASHLRDLMGEHPGVTPDHLTIEILDQSEFRDLEGFRATAEACCATGVRFAIDDFGTGHASLLNMRHLPAQEIKIDKAFVSDMLTNADDRAIVQGIIGLGKAFQRTVVAEGVETPEQVLYLIAAGCDAIQGFVLSPPLKPEDIPAWVSNFQPDPAWLARAGTS